MDNYTVVTSQPTANAGAVSAVLAIIGIVFYLVCSIFKAIQYKKAGENPVAAFIPIWNVWVWVKIATGKGAKMFLFLIPIFGQLLPIVYNYKYYYFFTQSPVLPILSYFFGPIVELIITFGKYPVNKNLEDEYDEPSDSEEYGMTNAFEQVTENTNPVKMVSMKCKSCHKTITNLQPGQVFYCGYCMTELTAPMK